MVTIPGSKLNFQINLRPILDGTPLYFITISIEGVDEKQNKIGCPTLKQGKKENNYEK
jgi:hypothetical protein